VNRTIGKRRPVINAPKKDMTLNVLKSTFEWVNRAAKARGVSRSCLIEEILIDNLPEAYANGL